MWELGQFFMLVVPSILVVVGMGLVGSRKREGWERRRMLFLLASAAISIGLLDLLILTNPYGREISSSLTAIGVVPVTVALLTTLFNQPGELRRLSSQNKLLVSMFAIAILALLVVLYWLEPLTLYVVLIPTLVMGGALFLALRLGMLWLTGLSLVIAVCTFWLGGGWFWIPQMDAPAWQQALRSATTMVVILLTILLPAALLYACLRVEGAVEKRKLAWSVALSVLLLMSAAYQIYWDGIWSSAHARAYEDHLPLNQFLMSLMAGVLLALSLRGRRRWVGLAYTLGVMVLGVSALSAGWRVSAFDMTAQRANRVDTAIQAYHTANGSYPTDLSALSPRYQLLLLPPVVVRQGGWCYQGGADGYRLGYVSGDFTYFEAHFREELFRQVGAPPATGEWRCDTMVERLQQGGMIY
jgi:hypothetical protein